MVTFYKTVVAHVVLKDSSSVSLSSEEKLCIEAFSSGLSQSRFRGCPTCAFAQSPTAEGFNEHLEILNDFIFEFMFCKWSWRNNGACTRGLEPSHVWVHLPVSVGWGLGLLLSCSHPETTAAFPTVGCWAWVPGCWVGGRHLVPVRVCTCLASILVL